MKMVILVCLICRYIMLNQFLSSRKLKICVEYLRMLSKMKAYIFFYFQDTFQEIRIINIYFIIHVSVNIYMCCKSVWLT